MKQSKYIPRSRKVKEKVDLILQENLSKKDLRRLLTLIKSIHAWNRMGYNQMKLFVEEEMDAVTFRHSIIRKQLPIAEEIISLYEKAGVSDNDWSTHWEVTWFDQKNLREQYNYMAKPPRQDNKTYINKGNGHPHPNKIRYPRKKRKTAWKRFYKLFPHLNYKNY